jgi:propanediol utilization protein
MSSVVRKPHAPRFVRLSSGDVSSLFGGESLEPRFQISNGRFVARQRLDIVGQKGRIDGVPVVGPPGDRTEISWSPGDHERIGLDEKGVILVGAAGEIKFTAPS